MPGGTFVIIMSRGLSLLARQLPRLPLQFSKPLCTARGVSEATVSFVKFGVETPVRAPIGVTLLELAKANGIELEGACDGECACSTCHLILEQRAYDALEPPTEDELDMLDMAYEVKDTSRLGCQVRVTRELNDTRFALPETDWLP